MSGTVEQAVQTAFADEWARIVATLIRRTGKAGRLADHGGREARA